MCHPPVEALLRWVQGWPLRVQRGQRAFAASGITRLSRVVASIRRQGRRRYRHPTPTGEPLSGEVLDELDEIERVLSLPYGEISGMSRNRLLAVHTQRLRQLWEAFQRRRWPGGALAAFRPLLA